MLLLTYLFEGVILSLRQVLAIFAQASSKTWCEMHLVTWQTGVWNHDPRRYGKLVRQCRNSIFTSELMQLDFLSFSKQIHCILPWVTDIRECRKSADLFGVSASCFKILLPLGRTYACKHNFWRCQHFWSYAVPFLVITFRAPGVL